MNDIYDKIDYYIDNGESIYIFGNQKTCNDALEYCFNSLKSAGTCLKIHGQDFVNDSLKLTQKEFQNKYYDKALFYLIDNFDEISKEKRAVDILLDLVEDESVQFVIASTRALNSDNYDEDLVAGLSGFQDIQITSRPANVISYYVLCNKLKDTIRSGWQKWHVQRERLESIAEHVYGVQMLAIAMYSEYDYDISIEKVILMLAVHELEETVIGDLVPFEITKAEKAKIGHEAVERILDGISDKADLKSLIYEFDAESTPEAKFAHLCDKLEADIQCKLYDEENCVDWQAETDNALLKDPKVRTAADFKKSWSDCWITCDQDLNFYDSNFVEVLDYLKAHHIKP